VIVTRRRKPRPHYGRYAVALLALAAIGFVLCFPPTQRIIATGPTAPAWNAGAHAAAVVARPLSFAGQQATITERNREIRDLDARLEKERVAKLDADARASRLQQQIAAAAAQPDETPAPAPRAVATVAADAPFAAGTGAETTAGEKRLAASWAAMEPEHAAAVVQRLPDDEVTRVLGQMDPDAAGAILDALPPAVAARISRAVAQVRSPANR
jgi:flagellar motility protein MotE (MotC chaperone)